MHIVAQHWHKVHSFNSECSRVVEKHKREGHKKKSKRGFYKTRFGIFFIEDLVIKNLGFFLSPSLKGNCKVQFPFCKVLLSIQVDCNSRWKRWFEIVEIAPLWLAGVSMIQGQTWKMSLCMSQYFTTTKFELEVLWVSKCIAVYQKDTRVCIGENVSNGIYRLTW